MWPDYDEQTRTTEAAEWALEQAYHYALAMWIPPVLGRVLDVPEDAPPDLDFMASADAQELWDLLLDAFVVPTMGYLWCYAYAQTQWALGINPFASLRAAGDAWRPDPRIVGRPFVPGVDEEPPWKPFDPTPLPGDKGMPPKPKPPSSISDEQRAEALERMLNPRYYRGLAPDGASENNTSDFPTWVANVTKLVETIRRLDPTFEPEPNPPFETFPRTAWVQYGTPAKTAENTLSESRITRRWVEENWPAPTPPRQGQQRLGLDLVARLAALAWDTNPSQVKMTALLAWDQVSSRRRLEMFLGSYDPPVGTSVPSRVRDLLVGTTNKNSRRAIPLSALKEELGLWGRMATEVYGGKSTPSAVHARHHADVDMLWDRLPARSRVKWETEADVRSNSGYDREYEADFVPNVRRPAADFFQPYRDLARQYGMQAAGIINQGMLAAASTSGVEFDKVWCAHMDRRTRHTHFAADGQKVSLDGTFTVGGAQLEFPGDPSGPSQEIRNCRCRVGMAPPDEPLPKEMKRNSAQKNEIIHRQRQGLIRAREDPAGIGYVPPALLAESMTAAVEQETPTMSEASFRTFTDAVVAFIGTPTSDGRMLSRDIALTFRAFPLPLMWMKQSEDGHTSAYTVGVIEHAEQRDDAVLASGYLLNTPEADEAADQLAHGITRPSVDLAAASWIATDAEGNEVSEDSGGPVFMTMTEAELIGTTLVATPAFGDTALSLNPYRESRDVAMVAAAAQEFRPRVYDHRLFENPNLTEPTLPTMGDDGRIYGHLACFGQCHRSIQSECVVAPRSRTGYAHFHTSPAVRLDDGTRLPVGRLTVGTGHAHSSVSGRVAAAHYDNTGTCFALVRVGEDAHGIWFSGVAAPWATPEQVEMGLASPLSGDWRDFGQGLELVAALAVNTPGFSARGRSDDQGRPIALVASLGPTMSEDEHIDIRATVHQILDEERQKAEQARVAAERDALLARAADVSPLRSPSEEITDLLAGRR